MSSYDPNKKDALIEQMFFQIDKNKDFNLTKEEFIEHYTNTSNIKERTTKLEAIKLFVDGLYTANLNSDDKISYGEFWRNLLADQDISKDTMKMFVSDKMVNEFTDMYDINKDGVVTSDEIAKVDDYRNEEQEKKEQEYTNKTDKTKNGLSTGAIVGIIIGATTLIGIIIVMVALLTKKKRKNEHKDVDNNVQENLNATHDNEKSITQ